MNLGMYDFSDGQLPNPRYLISNWTTLPEGTTFTWKTKPIVTVDGLQNHPEIEVRTPDVTTTIVSDDRFSNISRYVDDPVHGDGLSLLPYVDSQDLAKIKNSGNIDDFYNYSSEAVLKSYPEGAIPGSTSGFPVYTVGNNQKAADFVKTLGKDATKAFWAVQPDMTKQGITHGMIEVEYPKTKFPDGEEISNNLFFFMAFMEVKKPQKPNPEPEPDPIPVPTPDTLPDIAEDPERAHDEDQSEDKQPEEKKQTTRTVVTKASVVKKTVTKPVTQQKRAAMPQTGNQGLLVLALGAAM